MHDDQASGGQGPAWLRALGSRTDGERVIGCYLSPLRVFGLPIGGVPSTDWATEVIRRRDVLGLEVLITRMGGLFVRPPLDLSNPYAGDEHTATDLLGKMTFEETATSAFNHVLCELALDGMWSEPVSPVHISFGQLIDDRFAVVTVSSGAAGANYLERTLGPVHALLTPEWLSWTVHPESVLDGPIQLRRAHALHAISPTLPTLVCGAYSAASRRLLAECVIVGWIVIEQVLDQLWRRYVDALPETDRRGRLGDTRTYTAAVRTEMLFTAGLLPQTLYDELNKARSHRNRLAHRAQVDLRAAQDVMIAMHSMLGLVIGSRTMPSLSAGVNW